MIQNVVEHIFVRIGRKLDDRRHALAEALIRDAQDRGAEYPGSSAANCFSAASIYLEAPFSCGALAAVCKLKNLPANGARLLSVCACPPRLRKA
jgi:hypothetical protein